MHNTSKLFKVISSTALAAATAAVIAIPTHAEGTTIKLGVDKPLTQPIVIESGETVTLDLNDQNLTVDGDAIVNKGTLTIKGSGTVKSTRGAITNAPDGNLTIEGGNYTSTSWYAIKNLGSMTINNATVTEGNAGSSLIDNGWYGNDANDTIGGTQYKEADYGGRFATLTINNGTFSGGLNTVKNDDNGSLTVNGGTFSNTQQVPIMNWNIATITGGTFQAPSGNDKTAVFNGSAGSSSVDKGVLEISGGTFETDNIVEFGGSNVADTITKISGGNFTSNTAVINPALSGGNVTVSGGTFKTLPEQGEDENVELTDTRVQNADGTYTLGNPEPAPTSTPAAATTTTTAAAPAPTASAWVNPTLMPAGYQGYTQDGQLVTSLGDGTVVDSYNVVWDGFGNRLGYYDWNTGTVVKPAAAPAPAAGRTIVPNTGVK